jgi:hypothetical protein
MMIIGLKLNNRSILDKKASTISSGIIMPSLAIVLGSD